MKRQLIAASILALTLVGCGDKYEAYSGRDKALLQAIDKELAKQDKQVILEKAPGMLEIAGQLCAGFKAAEVMGISKEAALNYGAIQVKEDEKKQAAVTMGRVVIETQYCDAEVSAK